MTTDQIKIGQLYQHPLHAGVVYMGQTQLDDKGHKPDTLGLVVVVGKFRGHVVFRDTKSESCMKFWNMFIPMTDTCGLAMIVK
jgi:hypothetical protein